MNDDLMIKKHY